MFKTVELQTLVQCFIVFSLLKNVDTHCRDKTCGDVEAGSKRTVFKQDLVGTSLTRSLLGKIGERTSSDEFAFLYLHNKGTAPLFNNKDVNGLLNSPYKMLPPLNGKQFWPQTATASNFVLSGVDLALAQQGLSIEGHAEHKVLQRLPAMVQEFKEMYKACPSYVIMGSGLVPCSDVTLKRPSCTVEAFQKYMWLVGPSGGNCPGTKFVVGYDVLPPHLAGDWASGSSYLQTKGIYVVSNNGKTVKNWEIL